MKTRVRQFCWISIGILNMLLAVPAFAVDNPDAPDYVAEFQKRAQYYEDKIGPVAGTTSGVIAAYAEYNKFLEAELNRSYRALTRKLNPERKKQLVESQKKWLAFRDAEYAFIAANWTVRQFGRPRT